MNVTKRQLFQAQEIRSMWDDEAEKWWFSIVDVVATLTESADATAYWRKLKQRLKAEGNETVTNCHGLKMRAVDGKLRKTLAASTQQLLRIIQSEDKNNRELLLSFLKNHPALAGTPPKEGNSALYLAGIPPKEGNTAPFLAGIRPHERNGKWL